MIREFLQSKLISVGFLWIGYFLFLLIFMLIDVPFGTIAMISFAFIFIQLSWLITSFFYEKKRYEEMKQQMEKLEETYLLGEVLRKPRSLVEHKYYEAMLAVSRDAISRVEQSERSAKEYKEYVEQWIHEIKTPLTAMSLILANEQDVWKLRRELKRADNLTENILHYARLDSIEKDKQLKEHSLNAILNDVVKNQMDLLIASKMKVEIEGDANIYTDNKALQFIVNQLLTNSAKYCPGAKITMRVEGTELIYEDDGIGILAHELERITERGYTGSNGRKLGTSTGMGLYIVAQLCKELHIELKIKSEHNNYTRFQLIFPNLTEM
ncbi:sensor histidine kinase [Solibacillus merdavium]|uniref:histidine kinase n=1 Tax=Solibacillus merdavium TaxID=2762218 RepID=A0ABR8XNJ7_9BACL|nr:sensor histidine kinase [Solibacillus merdavium]MBD8033491.1 sensor histidine kinase [Solibacillus merdavium]